MQQITYANTIHWNPSWSPTGDWLAYIARSDDWTHQLHKVSLQTGLTTQLTYDAGSKFYPDWSPDGRHILFSKAVELDDGRYSRDIYLMDVAMQVTTALVESQWEENFPTWSPDGSRFAFVSSRSGHAEVWVFDLATETLSQLTGSAISHINEAEWSPIDNRIIISSMGPDYLLESNLFLLTID